MESYDDPQVRRRWEIAISDAIQSLRYSPERGVPCGYVNPRLLGLRRIPVSGFPFHLVFYQVISTADTVRVVDVVDGRRDLHRLIGT